MEELFNIIGKLYVDIYNTQKIIEILQTQIKDKDKEISELKQRKYSKDDNG
jgi:cell division protein FtsL